MRKLILGALSLALAACTTASGPAPLTAASAAWIEGDVRYLASDALEGRGIGTPGFAKASQYVADRFAAVGAQPGGVDGSYFQPVGLLVTEYGDPAANTLSISGPGAPEGLVAFENYVVGPSGKQASGEIEAPLVFVGQGFVDPRRGRDDLAGVDLKGKIAVALWGAPDFLGSEEGAYFRGQRSRAIAARGAVGLITLSTPALAKIWEWDNLVKAYRLAPDATWIGADGTPWFDRGDMLAFIALNEAQSARLMQGQPMDLATAVATTNDPGGRFTPFEMGLTAKIGFDARQKRITSRNVIGMVRGSDPALAGEYVVLSAHVDHLGVHPESEGEDHISNGAMDNASGTATLIDIARRLAADPPRRSVLLIALTAEESGLIGSDYNAHNPTVPAGSVVADVNLDMPILTYPFTDVVAFGAERSTLFPAVQAATRAAGVALTPDPNPEEGLFTRSDHYSWVRQGIPSVYLDTGPANGGAEAFDAYMKAHYHDVSDEPDIIDYRQAARFADLNYAIARNIANMDKRPVWKKGDFFATMFGGAMEE